MAFNLPDYTIDSAKGVLSGISYLPYKVLDYICVAVNFTYLQCFLKRWKIFISLPGVIPISHTLREHTHTLYIYTNVCVVEYYIHTCVCVVEYIYINIHIHIHTCVCWNLCTHIFTHVCVVVYIYTYIYTRVCGGKYIHMYTHTYTYTYM
jgi:hypothetical protein